MLWQSFDKNKIARLGTNLRQRFISTDQLTSGTPHDPQNHPDTCQLLAN
jgi:hypothetical protein